MVSPRAARPTLHNHPAGGAPTTPASCCSRYAATARTCCACVAMEDCYPVVCSLCMRNSVCLCGCAHTHRVAHVRVAPIPRLTVTLFVTGEYWRDQFSPGSGSGQHAVHNPTSFEVRSREGLAYHLSSKRAVTAVWQCMR
jgi:hypothetical protein